MTVVATTPEIGEKLRQLSIQPVALVIDDDYDPDAPPSQGAWTVFLEELSEFARSYNALDSFLSEKGLSISVPQPIQLLTGWLENLQCEETTSIKDLVIKYSGDRSPLDVLGEVLASSGFEIMWRSGPVELERLPHPPCLFVVDYHLDPEPEEGTNAREVFKKAMEKCGRFDAKEPPFIILMSRKLRSENLDEISLLAEESGLFRFNYEFLQKLDFVACPSLIELALRRFVRHATVSRAYYTQLLNLRDATIDLASNAARRLFQITPAEIENHRGRIAVEGETVSSMLTSLFSEIVSEAVLHSAVVGTCMEDLDRALTVEPLPALSEQEAGPFHRLYADLLFSQRSDKDPPEFGDIYEDRFGTFHLVISQECDLASGVKRQAKAKSVVCLRGIIHDTAPTKDDGACLARPFFHKSKSRWMWWDLQDPGSIPYRDLYHKNAFEHVALLRPYKKRFKLRHIDAEDIQHQFATRLTRIGTDLIPDAVRVVPAHFHFKPGDFCFPVDLGLVVSTKDYSLAVLKPAQLVKAFSQCGIVASLDKLTELSVYSPKKRFDELLAELNVKLVKGSDALPIIAAGHVRHWPGFKAWTVT